MFWRLGWGHSCGRSDITFLCSKQPHPMPVIFAPEASPLCQGHYVGVSQQEGAGTGTCIVSATLLSRCWHSASPIALAVQDRQFTLLWHCTQLTLRLHCLPPYEETGAESSEGDVCTGPGLIAGTTCPQVPEETAAFSLSCDTHSYACCCLALRE